MSGLELEKMLPKASSEAGFPQGFLSEAKKAFDKFYKRSREERLKAVAEFAELTSEEIGLLQKESALAFEVADKMVENVVGTFPLPFGVATNFYINGKDYLIPMVIEEPSVVAAASYSAKLARVGGGFLAETDEPIMIAQVQVIGVKNLKAAITAVKKNKKKLLVLADAANPTLKPYGGGARDLESRIVKSKKGKMLVLHLLVDVRDAMGANAVNTMAEGIAGKVEELTKGKVLLKIISNLAVHRKARAKAIWKKEVLEESAKELGMKGAEVVDAILWAYELAANDQFRGTTHNKGIMNGIDAVTIATGNDWRAVEAGAHSFAAFGKRYTSLTRYTKDKNGNLVGEIELPIAVGTVGGATRSHPVAKIGMKILGVKSAKELAGVLAAVGLAQNFAALRALATEGIQKGHMRLHSKNVAVAVGAKGEMVDKIAAKMVEEKRISPERAEELLKEMAG